MSKENLLDDISRILASSTSRRKAFRLIAGAVIGGTGASLLGPQKAYAASCPRDRDGHDCCTPRVLDNNQNCCSAAHMDKSGHCCNKTLDRHRHCCESLDQYGDCKK